MKIIFFLIAIIFATTSSKAQLKIDPNKVKEIAASEKRLKEIAAKKANADKILNATVVSFKFNVFADKPSSGFFNKREITLKGLGNNKFKTPTYILKAFSANNTNNNGVNTWQFNSSKGEADKDGYGGIVPDTYQNFLNNGFTVSIKFTDRADRILESEFTANFSIDFLFSDGTTINVPLQGLTITGAKGSFKASAKRPFILDKNIEGNNFPDPNNPIILKPVN